MAEYIAESDVEKRLTKLGFVFVADRDEIDGDVDDSESANYITTAIVYAGNLIDEAVSGFMEPSAARSAGNSWLKDRAIDIAVARAIENGGRNVPDDLHDARLDALERLKEVRREELRVPGLTWSRPAVGSQNRTSRLRAYRI